MKHSFTKQRSCRFYYRDSHVETDKAYREKPTQELHKKATNHIGQIPEATSHKATSRKATSHKATAVRPPTTYL